MSIALLTGEDSDTAPAASAATSLTGMNRRRARQQQTRAAGILPTSALNGASHGDVFARIKTRFPLELAN